MHRHTRAKIPGGRLPALVIEFSKGAYLPAERPADQPHLASGSEVTAEIDNVIVSPHCLQPLDEARPTMTGASPLHDDPDGSECSADGPPGRLGRRLQQQAA